MLGAIIGDIAGSRFEWNNTKTKEFDFLTYRCHPTDDSVMTLAVAKALMESRNVQTSLSKEVVKWMQALGRNIRTQDLVDVFENGLSANLPNHTTVMAMERLCG